MLKIAKKNKIKIRIAHSHEAHKSISEHKLFRRPLIIFFKMLINNLVTHRFACSKEAGQWLFGKNAFKIINNAIDVKKYKFKNENAIEVKNELGITDKFVIGHIGNFSRAKNYPFLLEIFKTVHGKNNNTCLLLIGNNHNNYKVEKKVIEMGLRDSVIFTGVRSDIPDLLQSIGVYVFPSLYEGLGITVIEAQASGLKCILSDTITEEVKITDLVEFMSLEQLPEAWAEKILEYTNGYERRDTSCEIIQAGYDIQENAKWLENFYLSAVK